MTIRQKIKRILLKHPVVWQNYQAVKAQLKRFLMLRYCLIDILNIYRNMYWPAQQLSALQLTSALLFQYHKIEKGLVMPGPKRLFGEEPVRATMELLKSWESQKFALNDPIYLGALETLHAYHDRLESESLDPQDKIKSIVYAFLVSHSVRSSWLVTPQRLENINSQALAFDRLALARRSVRSFSPDQVPYTMIEEAVKLAQLSPSACNRQPCKVYWVDDEEKKKALLALQNGNRGFGHLIPSLAVITSDSGAFFDASERHEPYVDGGLFAMSLMYALLSQGLATCCLNWCVAPANDKALRKLLKLSESESVVMLMAIGFPAPNTDVPRSPRKPLDSVLFKVN